MNRKHRHGLTRRRMIAGTGAVAAGLTFLPFRARGQEDKKLNFYNWDTYIGETTLDDFKEATGIETQMDIFADTDEMFAKFHEGNPGYDVIVPSNDYVQRMQLADMLMPLDHDKIPNIGNVDDRFMDPSFDPGRQYSLPYMWGTIGLGYSKERIGGAPESWKSLYDSDELSGRIALLAEARTVIGIGMKYLGYSLNSTDPKQISEATELLIAQKPHIKVFADDNGQDLLASGEVDATQEWNGDIAQLMTEDDTVSYVVPKEGSMLFEDCLCIPKDAPHPDNAHAFMSFVFDAEVGAAIADFIQYATPNAAARKRLGDDYNKNPAIFPPDDVIAICESQDYSGEDVIRLFDDAWTRIQSA